MKILPVLLALAVLPAFAAPPDHSWHVLATAENGTVTLIKGLTKEEAEMTKCKLEQPLWRLPCTPKEKKQYDEQQKLFNPECPPADASKAAWAQWQKAHSSAEGCYRKNVKDKNGKIISYGLSTSWTGHTVSPGDIKSVEVFQ